MSTEDDSRNEDTSPDQPSQPATEPPIPAPPAHQPGEHDQPTVPITTETPKDQSAGADEFESGLDYGAFIDDDESAPSADDQPTTPLPDFLKDTPEEESQRTQVITGPGTAETSEVSHTVPLEPEQPTTDAPATHATTPLPRSLSGASAVGAGMPASSGLGAEVSDHEARKQRREFEARAAARDDALDAPKTSARVLQVLLAIFAPIVLLAGVVRLVASPIFLWVEYHRPGFPADEFGFDTAQRMTNGSYGLDYLFNFANSSYLADLQFQDGSPLFTESEISHMSDVKVVMLVTMLVGTVLAIASIVFMIILARIRKGAIRRALFAGSIWLLVTIIGLAVAAIIGWQSFFANFHSVFFAEGTWTFYVSDTLIRLYPNQFWIDAGIVVGALTVITAVVTLILTWPTKRRREDSLQAQVHMMSRKNYWADEIA